MATLREVIEYMHESDLPAGRDRDLAALLDMEVRFHTFDRHDMHLLSSYVAGGVVHIDIGE